MWQKKNKHTTAELEPGHILSTKEHKYQYLYITPEINIYALYYSKTDTAAVHLLHNMASTHWRLAFNCMSYMLVGHPGEQYDLQQQNTEALLFPPVAITQELERA